MVHPRTQVGSTDFLAQTGSLPDKNRTTPYQQLGEIFVRAIGHRNLHFTIAEAPMPDHALAGERFRDTNSKTAGISCSSASSSSGGASPGRKKLFRALAEDQLVVSVHDVVAVVKLMDHAPKGASNIVAFLLPKPVLVGISEAKGFEDRLGGLGWTTKDDPKFIEPPPSCGK